MFKYTILYKNGKTWNGKANHVNDIDVLSDKDIIHATVVSGNNVRLIYPSRSCGFVVTTNLYLNDHNHKANKVSKRTPNPTSKTKKQGAFDKAYADWVFVQRGVVDISIKAYKRWLWEQKKTTPDKDGFIPWNGGEMPVKHNIKVDLRFRDGEHNSSKSDAGVYYWKHNGSRSDIVAYKVYEDPKVQEEQPEPSEFKIKYSNGDTFSFSTAGGVLAAAARMNQWMKPIKTTYTFWLGADGSIFDEGVVDDK